MKMKQMKRMMQASLMMMLSVFFITVNAVEAKGSDDPYVAVQVVDQVLQVEVTPGSHDIERVMVGDRIFSHESGRPLRLAINEFTEGGADGITVYARDVAGNLSNVVTLSQEVLEENEASSVPEPPLPPNPLTPDGQATLVDVATDEDGKDFFTFVTPEGNEFFLVIDHQRASDNVFFLNAVTENDLLALAEASDEPFQPAIQPPLTPEELADLEAASNEPEEAEEEGGGHGTLIFIGLAILAVGGAAYYFKIVKPKQQGGFEGEEDEGDETEADLGEALTFESEAHLDPSIEDLEDLE